MKKINSAAGLKSAIIQLEIKQADERRALKEQYHLACESIKPINIIKNNFSKITVSPEFKQEIINGTIGLVTGYFSKMLFQGTSRNPMRKLLGSVLMFGISNVVARHPQAIRLAGKKVLNLILENTSSQSPVVNSNRG